MNWKQARGMLERAVMFASGIVAANPNLFESKWGQVAAGAIGLLVLVLGATGNTQAALVETVGQLGRDSASPVRGVIVEDTPEGRAMASTDASVTIAGSPSARYVAAAPAAAPR